MMSDDVTTSEILRLINERDQHTQDKLVDIMQTLDKVCKHIIISEEDKRHGAEFKKEVREHIKFAEPILHKSKEVHEARGKIVASLTAFLLVGLLGTFLKFG